MMYSAIEEYQRPEVIQKCYWPLLDLAESGVPLGIELSGLTLEIIQAIDPEWVKSFRNLLSESKIELVGSGYSQIIGPIVPHEVNQWNQSLGVKTYLEILGCQPRIALVNEMAYSASMIPHYIDAGYEAIIMEWNNPHRVHPEWNPEWRYHPQRAKGLKDECIIIIWSDSIAFQKYQRCIHQEAKVDDHVSFLKTHSRENNRYYPLYTADAEIFNFRPNRYESEAELTDKDDWKIVREVYARLKSEKWSQLVFPSDVLKNMKSSQSNNLISLESPEQPIPVKKQEKYNIIRWALTGRGDLEINTICYRYYKALISNHTEDAEQWRELCYLWSSDFRTHLTQRRWEEYGSRLLRKIKELDPNESGSLESANSTVLLPIIEGDVKITEGEFYLRASNSAVSTLFNKRKGLAIKSCVFHDISSESLFGTLDHGYYDDISYSSDYFSGHGVIEALGEHKITDLGSIASPSVSRNKNLNLIEIKAGKAFEDKFRRSIILEEDGITLRKTIALSHRYKARIHPFIFTLNESAWDTNTLTFSCHNGHKELEEFMLRDKEIDHTQSFSLLITAKQGFGATGGIIEIKDKDKRLTFQHDQTLSALIPYLVFKPVNGGKYFIRLIYSAQEIDETFVESDTMNTYQIQAKINIKASRIES